MEIEKEENENVNRARDKSYLIDDESTFETMQL